MRTIHNISIGVVLFMFFTYLPAYSCSGGHNLHRTFKQPDPKEQAIYETVIVPWIENDFSEDTRIGDGVIIKRGLKMSKLLRYENIEEQNRYTVHIEFSTSIRGNGVNISGLKGQEIVFWVEGSEVKDYFPFEEYWIERSEKEEHLV